MESVKEKRLRQELVSGWWWVSLAVLPLLFTQRWEWGWEWPKLLFLSGFVPVGLVLSWLVKDDGCGGKGKNISIWWVIWILSLIMASLQNLSPNEWFLGRAGRWQGWLFYILLSCVVVGISWISDREVFDMKKSWLVGAVISVILGCWWFWKRSKGYWLPSYGGREASSFGQSNYWSQYLVVGAVWWWYSDKAKEKWRWIICGMVVIGVLLARSWWALVVLLGMMAVRKMKRRYVVGLLLGGLLMLGLVVQKRGFTWLGNRRLIWQRSVEKIMVTPRGYGLISLDREGLTGEKILGEVNGINIDRAHNVILEQWLMGGWLGGAAFLMLWIKLYERGVREQLMGVGMGLLAWLLLSSVYVVGVVNWVWWAVLVGLVKGRVRECGKI